MKRARKAALEVDPLARLESVVRRAGPPEDLALRAELILNYQRRAAPFLDKALTALMADANVVAAMKREDFELALKALEIARGRIG